MNRHATHHRRGRALATFTAVAGLCLGTAAAAIVPAAAAVSAEPAGDCTAAYPIADLARDQVVHGLTVTSGTMPEAFTGKVLGVLNDGIRPGLDMVMVDLASDASPTKIDEVGIWQGMSGSPVYADDGRLIGAVAYGLSWGASTVAGVTPFEAMKDRLAPDAPATVPVGPALARRIASSTDVTAAQALGGFDRLPLPMGVSGVSASRLATAAQRAGTRTWLPDSAREASSTTGAGAADGTVDDIVAGGNLAASISWGDVTIAAVGTTTWVCNGRVLGFGHPAGAFGATTLGLHPASAIYIAPDLIAGFKVANVSLPVGTITEDRGTGIAGDLGTLPTTTDVDGTVVHGADQRTLTSHVALRTPDGLASTAFYGLLGALDTVVDGPVTEGAAQDWTVTGTDAEGDAFELAAGDLYAGSDWLQYDLGFALGDLVYGLARIPGVTVTSVDSTTDVHDVTRHRVTALEVRQHGVWTTVGRRTPAVARAGRALVARVTLAGGGTTTRKRARLHVPETYSGRVAALDVVGGLSTWDGRMPRSIGKLRTWLAERVRNDQVRVTLDPGPRSEEFMRATTSGPVRRTIGPVGGVVRGHRAALVVVR